MGTLRDKIQEIEFRFLGSYTAVGRLGRRLVLIQWHHSDKFLSIQSCCYLNNTLLKKILFFMRIITYNLFARPKSKLGGQVTLTGEDGQWERLYRIPKLLQKYKPDILCVQELFCPSGFVCLQNYSKLFFDRVRSKLGLTYKTNVPGSLLRPVNSGLCIFSRWPITNHSFVLFPARSREWVMSKGCQYAVIQKKASPPIHIFNLHLHAGQTEEANQIREAQMKITNDFIRSKHIPPTAPVSLVGDFNQHKLPNTAFDTFLLLRYTNHPREIFTYDSRRNELIGKDGGAGRCVLTYYENLLHRTPLSLKPCPCCIRPSNFDKIFIRNLRGRARILPLETRKPFKIEWSSSGIAPRSVLTRQVSDHYPVLCTTSRNHNF